MKALCSRRGFLTLAAAACAARGRAGGGAPMDPDLVALFADTHVTSDPARTYQRDGLTRCVRDVLAHSPRPANVLLYGDLSVNVGEPDDYRTLKALLKPLEDAGVRWHATLGNHDRRESFFSVFPELRLEPPPVPGRHVSVVSTPRADFILLDSCIEGSVGGGIDDAQRAWLAETLARASKPVFVGAHHPLKETAVAGLLAACTRVKGYIYGHNHAWRLQREESVDTLCLPSTGHWGDIGYALVRLGAEEAVFTLRQHDYYSSRPAARPEDVKPEWRARVEKNDGSRWSVPLT